MSKLSAVRIAILGDDSSFQAAVRRAGTGAQSLRKSYAGVRDAAKDVRAATDEYGRTVADLERRIALAGNASREAAMKYEVTRGSLVGLTREQRAHVLELGRQADAADRAARSAEGLRATWTGVGSAMQRMGAYMTLGVSAPLIAFGKASFDAAKELQSLKMSLAAVMGDAEAANREFKQLSETAKLPGLDLRQAVRGSTSLQALKVSAAESRKILGELGNAIALFGGGRAEFERAVTNIQQIAGAATLTGDEIRELSQQIPILRQKLIELYGTAAGEELAKKGLSGLQVIRDLTREFETLARVPPNTLKNNLENLEQDWFLFKAAAGSALAPLAEKWLPRAAEALQSASAKLQSMSSEEIEGGLRKIALLIAAGPALSILGSAISATNSIIKLTKALRDLTKAQAVADIAGIGASIGGIGKGAGTAAGQVSGLLTWLGRLKNFSMAGAIVLPIEILVGKNVAEHGSFFAAANLHAWDPSRRGTQKEHERWAGRTTTREIAGGRMSDDMARALGLDPKKLYPAPPPPTRDPRLNELIRQGKAGGSVWRALGLPEPGQEPHGPKAPDGFIPLDRRIVPGWDDAQKQMKAELDALRNPKAHAAAQAVGKDLAWYRSLPADKRKMLLDWWATVERQREAQRGRADPSGRMSRAQRQVMPLIERAAYEAGVDPRLLTELVRQESGFNPRARSRAGAMGLAQLMPGTALDLGVKNPWDPYENLLGGARYLRRQLDRFGSVEEALAAYNAGPGAVAKHGGIPPYRETRNYVRNIMARYTRGGSGSGLGIPGLVAESGGGLGQAVSASGFESLAGLAVDHFARLGEAAAEYGGIVARLKQIEAEAVDPRKRLADALGISLARYKELAALYPQLEEAARSRIASESAAEEAEAVRSLAAEFQRANTELSLLADSSTKNRAAVDLLGRSFRSLGDEAQTAVREIVSLRTAAALVRGLKEGTFSLGRFWGAGGAEKPDVDKGLREAVDAYEQSVVGLDWAQATMGAEAFRREIEAQERAIEELTLTERELTKLRLQREGLTGEEIATVLRNEEKIRALQNVRELKDGIRSAVSEMSEEFVKGRRSLGDFLKAVYEGFSNTLIRRAVDRWTDAVMKSLDPLIDRVAGTQQVDPQGARVSERTGTGMASALGMAAVWSMPKAPLDWTALLRYQIPVGTPGFNPYGGGRPDWTGLLGGLLQTALPLLFGGRRAEGGDVLAGRLYEVNERRGDQGREYFVPSTGGRVYPLGRDAARAAGFEDFEEDGRVTVVKQYFVGSDTVEAAVANRRALLVGGVQMANEEIEANRVGRY